MAALLHPLVVFFTSRYTLVLAAAYTNRDSSLRYAAFAFMILCAYVFPASLASFAATTGWAGRVMTGGVAVNVMAYFDRLIVRRWDLSDYETQKRKEVVVRSALNSPRLGLPE